MNVSSITPNDLKDTPGLTKAKTSKARKLGRSIATKNHDALYCLSSLAMVFLFLGNLSFNLMLGWYQGGFLVGSIILMIAYGSTDVSMGYFLGESIRKPGSNVKRLWLARLGFVVTVYCTLISLVASVQMMDAFQSVDFSQASSLEKQLDQLNDQQDKMFEFGQNNNAAAMRKDIMGVSEEIANAQASAYSDLGYHPSHAAFVEGGTINKITGMDFGQIRMSMAVCVVICYILLCLVYKVDWTDDGETELLESNLNQKKSTPRVRVAEGSQVFKQEMR